MRTFPDFAVKKARIEVIPMIDVMMFLLVFFVLISINVIPAGGLKVALPSLSTLEKNVVPKKKSKLKFKIIKGLLFVADSKLTKRF